MAIDDNPVLVLEDRSGSFSEFSYALFAELRDRMNPPQRIKLTLSQAQMDADDARIEQIAEEYFYQRSIEG